MHTVKQQYTDGKSSCAYQGDRSIRGKLAKRNFLPVVIYNRMKEIDVID